ncbi:hypothetical protein GS531_07630 [Rhodococcus hoagii]|nr:hypothetical protein [Prescottella equi]
MIDKAKGLPGTRSSSTSRTRWRRSRRAEARARIVDALGEDGWGDQLKVVRVNDWTTEGTHADSQPSWAGLGPLSTPC